MDLKAYQAIFSHLRSSSLADRYLAALLQKADLEASRTQVYLVVGGAIAPIFWCVLFSAWAAQCLSYPTITNSTPSEVLLAVQALLLLAAGVCGSRSLFAHWGLLFPKSRTLASELRRRLEHWRERSDANGGGSEARRNASDAVIEEETAGLLAIWATVADAMHEQNEKLWTWVRMEVALLAATTIVQAVAFATGTLPLPQYAGG